MKKRQKTPGSSTYRLRKIKKLRQQKVGMERIRQALRNRIRAAVLGSYRAGSAVSDLGCSIAEFRDFIAAQFVDGMSWENYGKWHLDHVRPLASFNLSDRAQFLIALHYTNYQPLWAADNVSKGSRLLVD